MYFVIWMAPWATLPPETSFSSAPLSSVLPGFFFSSICGEILIDSLLSPLDAYILIFDPRDLLATRDLPELLIVQLYVTALAGPGQVIGGRDFRLFLARLAFALVAAHGLGPCCRKLRLSMALQTRRSGIPTGAGPAARLPVGNPVERARTK